MWTECSDCDKTCVSGNRPGKCDSCSSVFKGQRKTTYTSTKSQTTQQRRKTTVSPPSMPSSPDYGY